MNEITIREVLGDYALELPWHDSPLFFNSRRNALNVKRIIEVDCSVPNSSPTCDMVEVVRCKDCDVPHNKWLGCPNLNGLIPPPDFYCARGERKDGAE